MIATAGIVALVTRTVVSLGIVLAVVAVAYLVARRRAGGVAPVASGAADRARFGRRRTAPPAIEVVGRVGLTRSTAAVAVRFADRVILVAASEQGASSVLGEMPADAWDEHRTVREPITPSTPSADDRTPSIVGARPNFVEALRQATARHG